MVKNQENVANDKENTNVIQQTNLVDATKMLEEALEKIDGILERDELNHNHSNLTVEEAAEQLFESICINLEKAKSCKISESIQLCLVDWLYDLSHVFFEKKAGTEKLKKSILLFQKEKSHLENKISSLENQIESQKTKLIDAEQLLIEKEKFLSDVEASLERELRAKSFLEKDRINLLSEIKSVYKRYSCTELENQELKKLLQYKIMDGQCSYLNCLSPYGTLPRNKNNCLKENINSEHDILFDKGFSSLKMNKNSETKCSSAPNLVDHIVPNKSNSINSSNCRPPLPTNSVKKVKNKKPSVNMSEFHVGDIPELKRGGLRATSLARITCQDNRNNKPFKEWSTEMVCNWIQEMGFNCYISQIRTWCRGGEHFLSINSKILERELYIKNPLHRKKIELSVKALRLDSKDAYLIAAGKLDNHLVIRWLDDIGLPQYKDSFLEERIDGRMLHFLTVDDLLQLKVNSSLHAASIKRGIQNNFDLSCLKRRSLPDENIHYSSINEVILWTNHRVMEWLRTVDLAEYAPNLRGSGVHGGLIIFEPRFNDDLLATLLSIPSNKTLLRRHLNIHFGDLIGRDIIVSKRETEVLHSLAPLSPASRIKVSRRVVFPLLRIKTDNQAEELLCPLD